MISHRLMALLLKPSLFSMCITMIIAIATVGFEGWSLTAASPILYEAFYGEQGFITFLELSPNLINPLKALFNSNPITYGIGVFLVAITAGLLASTAAHSTKRLVVDINELNNPDIFDRQRNRQRFILRAILITAWLIYWLVFLKFILPFCLLLSRISTDGVDFWRTALIWISAALALTFALHIHVVFIRLIALRPRVFGGELDIQDALIH